MIRPAPSGTSISLRDFLQLLAVGRLGDLAGNAAAARGVGHQHAVAAGQRQIGGQRRALVAAFFLDHLDQHDLPDLDDFLDLVAPGARLARLADFLGHVLFGDGFDLVIGLAGVVDGAVGRPGPRRSRSSVPVLGGSAMPRRAPSTSAVGARLLAQIDHVHAR
jgi:hypothetical protein